MSEELLTMPFWNWICHFFKVGLRMLKKLSVSDSLNCYNKITLAGWFKQQAFILTILEAGSPISVATDSVRAIYLAYTWLPSWCIFTWWREGEQALISSSSYKDTNLFMGSPLSWLNLNLTTSYMPLPPNNITMGIKTFS